MQNKGSSRSTWVNLVLPVALIIGLVLVLSLESGGEPSAEPLHPLENSMRVVVTYLSFGAEISAGIVIGVAMLRGIGEYILGLFKSGHEKPHATIETVRLRLGRSLVLGLEFTVASDILRTVVAPTRQDILTLSAIVLLRSLLNYFLEWEIERATER